MRGYVLVGGWPGSGKSTLSRSLAAELDAPLLCKDVVKEALMDALGAPSDVAQSRRLGRAAVLAVLAAARGCPAAVIDSTWYAYTEQPAGALPGPIVEVRCHVPLAIAQDRYRRRTRDPRHLDDLRQPSELWGGEVPPLGLGEVLDVDTSGPVDVQQLAASCRELLCP